MFSQVIIMTAAPSVLAGIVGAIIGAKKIEMPSGHYDYSVFPTSIAGLDLL